MPPLWFAATRFLAAGVILLAVSRRFGGWKWICLADFLRLTLMSAGAISVCFGLIFWGEQYVAAGISGVIVQGFVPVGLFFFAAIMGRAETRWRQWLSVLIGVGGVLLLAGHASSGWTSKQLLSIIGIVIGTLVYDWAGVYGGPTISRYPAALMSAFENLVGGVILLIAAWIFERKDILNSPLPTHVSTWISWIYLVIVGSVLGFTAYTYLLRAWGPTRTSAYAFVTPVIALLSGVAVTGESIGWTDIVGTVLVIGAAAGVAHRPRHDKRAKIAPLSVSRVDSSSP